MRTRRTHSTFCFIALTAYLLNLMAVSSGAVLCETPAGSPSLEIACDHDHCAPVIETDHDHIESSSEINGCRCASCPCEDTPLISDFALSITRDSGRMTLTHSVIPTILVQYSLSHSFLECRDQWTKYKPPFMEPSLQYLRTVVLIV